MAPPAADIDIQNSSDVLRIPVKGAVKSSNTSQLTGPLKYGGSLDAEEHFDVTNVIGREFPKLQLSDILHDDTKIRDLAILGEKQPMIPTL